MSRLKAGAASLLNFFSRVGRRRTRTPGSLRNELHLVAVSIHERALEGKSTTLRQMHKETGLSQMVALQAVAKLERLGLLFVERDVHDALESTVTLSEALRAHLRRNTERAAA